MSDTPKTTTETPAASWTDQLPEESKQFALAKGWKDPSQAVDSYQSLFKFMGADKAGRGVVLPDDKSTPEEINAFYTRLGRPQDVNGYEVRLPDGFPDPEFPKMALPLLHKHNLTKAQGEALMGDFAEMVTQGQKARMEAEQAEFVKQEAALKGKWADQFDRNVEIAKRGAKKLGFSDEIIDQLEAKTGFAGVIEALHNAGMLLGEGNFVESGFAAKAAETLDVLTAKRREMAADPTFGQRMHSADPATKAAAESEWKAIEDKIMEARKRA